MSVMNNFIAGMVKVLKITGSDLLYRYPYRTSSEGLRADWMKIGQDIGSVFGTIQSEAQHDQR